MRFLRHLLRIYSYIIEAILSLASLAMSAVIFASPHQTLRLGWLPWPDETLGPWLAGLGVSGLLVVILAAAGRLRWLLTLFALGVLLLIARGLFFTGWRFNGPADFRRAVFLVLALFVAFIGSIPMSSPGRPGYRSPRR